MKRYEDIQVISSRLVEHTCDICKIDIRRPKGHDYSHAEITASIGAIYLDCPMQTHYHMEFCTPCFDKVKELIEGKFGVLFREMED